MAYKIRALREGLGFGKEIVGLTRDDIASDAVKQEIRDCWRSEGLMVFRGSEVTPGFQTDVSRILGELEIHPIAELRAKENPELITLVSDKDKEGLFEIDGVQAVAFLPWHFDLSFMDHINRGGVLTAQRITSWGGETGFIDQAQAYDLLPDTLKGEIEGLEIVHQLCVDPGNSRYGTRGNVRTLKLGDFARRVGPKIDSDYPPVVHPVVFTHADSGRNILNLSPFGALYILGHDDEAGHALLRTLVDHMTSCPAYHHRWQPSEMLAWDNWRMAHSVSGAPAEEIRIMQRTTINGDYGFGRKLHERVSV